VTLVFGVGPWSQKRRLGRSQLFDEDLLLSRTGGQEEGIALVTRHGSHIGNYVAPEPTDRQRQTYDLLRKLRGGSWVNRKPATGVYNCFGMVFASRRTSVNDDDIEKVLREDGFRQLNTDEKPKTGDLVFYRAESAGLLHVAVVTRIDPILGSSNQELGIGGVWALSKWNDFCGEDEHNINNHAWGPESDPIAIEFFTDRP